MSGICIETSGEKRGNRLVQGGLAAEIPDATSWSLGFWPSNGAAYVQVVGAPAGVPISLEIPVTADACGTEIRASIVQSQADAQPFSVQMPECTGVGERLRLPLLE